MPPLRQGAQKSVEATQESIPYLTLRARTEHRVVSSPPHVVAACPASLLAQAARADRGEASEPHRHRQRWRRRRRVWDGKEEGAAAGLPVSTRVVLRYFL